MPKRTGPDACINPAKKTKTFAAKQPTPILDLNGDCLESVFSCLRPIDLCAMKETCVRFEAATNEHFRHKFYNAKLILDRDSQEYDSELVHFIDVVRMFGQFIRELRTENVDREDDEEATRFWEVIHAHCTHLQRLELIYCDLKFFNPIHAPAEPPLENWILKLTILRLTEDIAL